MTEEAMPLDADKETLVDRVLHWLWLAAILTTAACIGCVAGSYHMAVVMGDYVQQHYVCEEKEMTVYLVAFALVVFGLIGALVAYVR